jgi:TetR/AcrR family transcriptional regulator, copper-responsive repressor
LGINPPSLYAAFGNKAALFMEAVQHYETVYWTALWEHLHETAELREAIGGFFEQAASVLSSRDAPCGCLVTLSAPNTTPDSRDINIELKELRQETFCHFLKRLEQAKVDGDVKAGFDTDAFAYLLTTLLHGISIQARDGASQEQLVSIGQSALAILPSDR